MAYSGNTSLSKHLDLEQLDSVPSPAREGQIFAHGSKIKMLSAVSASGGIEGTSLDIEANGDFGGTVSAANLSASSDLQLKNSSKITAGTELDLSISELAVLDGVSPGTAAANKALVLNSNKEIGLITEITASRAKFTNAVIDVLDVNTINSVTTTQTSLEILDNTIVASSGSNSAQADGGGLQIGGTIDDDSDGVASLLYRNSGTKLEASIGSNTILTIEPTGVDVAGIVSGSGALKGSGVAVDLNLSASKDLQLKSSSKITAGSELDLTISELAFLDGAGTAVVASKAVIADSSKDVLGVRNISASAGGGVTLGGGGNFVSATGNVKVLNLSASSDVQLKSTSKITAGSELDLSISELAVLDGVSPGTGAASKALVLNPNQGITAGVNRFVASGITASAGAVVAGLNRTNGTSFSVHAGAATPSTTNFLAVFMSGAAGSPHSFNLNAGVAGGANGTLLSFTDPTAGAAADKGNLKFSGGILMMSSSADMTLRATHQTLGVNARLLHVSGAMEVDGNAQFDGSLTVGADGSGGTITANTYATHSDRELKTGIEPMTSALDKVMMLEPVTYEMKGAPGKSDLGFIAQDVAKIVPEICVVDGKGVGRAIDYGRMSAVLAGAVKAQQTQIDELKAVIAKLQK